jgi:hypothetical protein
VCIGMCGKWSGMCTCAMTEDEWECVSVCANAYTCVYVCGRISVCAYLGTPREAGTEQRSAGTPRGRGRDEGVRQVDKREREEE